MDPVVSNVLRLTLAWVLAESAIDKLRDRQGFLRTLAAYQLVPGSFLSASVVALTALETALAAALLSSASVSMLGGEEAGLALVAGLGSAALLGLYGAAIAVNLLRGRRDLDCGCGGPARHHSLGPALVVRNAVLVTAALAAALPAPSRSLTKLDLATTALAVLATILLRAAIEHLLANAPESARLRAEIRA